MNKELLEYLKQDGIGKVVAKGLADVYLNQPQAPVKYLAAWLKQYSKTQAAARVLEAEQKVKAQQLEVFNKEVAEAAKKAEEKVEKDRQHSSKIQQFMDLVQNHHYQEELLSEVVPQFIEQQLKLTGAYIGYVNHPPKQITEQDEDENAHLDTTQPKMINWIGSSISHRQLMIGKTLELDKGVTGGVFSLSLDDPEPNEEGVIEKKEKYVYVPNVVKNQNMFFIQWPKLGAYIAIPLVYNSYLHQSVFDMAVQCRQKYLTQLEQFNTAKDTALKEIQTEKEGIQNKLTEAIDKGDEAAIQTLKAELSECEGRLKEKEGEKYEDEKTELTPEKREFVVCGDTLSQDREIPLAHRTQLLEIVKHFRDCWQKQQYDLLYKDVDYQIRIQKNIGKKGSQFMETLDKCIEISAEQVASFDEIEDQVLREYKKQEFRLQALRKQIRDSPQYLASFFKLKNFRVVKFKELIQTLLHLLQYTKGQINLPGKTQLNWKDVRAKYLYANTFFDLLNYITEGPKTDNYPAYCKIGHILAKLQAFNEEEVFDYNVGLGSALRFAKRLLEHRRSNVEMRRAQKEKEKEKRNALVEENDRIKQEKKQALEKHKQTLSESELDLFKPEEWEAKWDEENPLKDLPPEVVDDIDNDF